MTPILVLVFGVNPASAVSADVVTSLVLKPFGGSVHVRRKTVNWRLVRWLMIGSIPSAFAGAYLLDEVVGTDNAATIKRILGWVLIVAAGAIVAKLVLQAHRRTAPVTRDDGPGARPAGPHDAHRRRRRPDRRHDLGRFRLAHHRRADVAVPEALVEGDGRHRPGAGDSARRCRGARSHDVRHARTSRSSRSVLIGAIPAVVAGAHFSSRGTDRYVRPVLVAVLTVSALGLLGVPTVGCSLPSSCRSCCSPQCSPACGTTTGTRVAPEVLNSVMAA